MIIWLDERMVKVVEGFKKNIVTHTELQKVYDYLKLEKEVKSAIKRSSTVKKYSRNPN